MGFTNWEQKPILFLVRVHLDVQDPSRRETITEVACSHNGAEVDVPPAKSPPRADGDVDYAFGDMVDMGRFLRYLGLEFSVRVTLMTAARKT